MTGVHGDFWPGNVFIADDLVEVIDFEGTREGLPYEDVAYFLVQLDQFFPGRSCKRSSSGSAGRSSPAIWQTKTGSTGQRTKICAGLPRRCGS